MTQNSPSSEDGNFGLYEVWQGFHVYYLTSLFALFGIVQGHLYFAQPQNPLAKRGDLFAALANWDGESYQTIGAKG